MEALWIADCIPGVLCVAQTTSEMLLVALVSAMLWIANVVVEALWIADGIPEVLCVAQTMSEILLMAPVVSQMLQMLVAVSQLL